MFQRFNISMFQRFNISTIKCFNVSTFRRFNISTFQRFNVSTSQLFNISTFQCMFQLSLFQCFNFHCFNNSTIECFNVSTFQRFNVSTFQRFNISLTSIGKALGPAAKLSFLPWARWDILCWFWNLYHRITKDCQLKPVCLQDWIICSSQQIKNVLRACLNFIGWFNKVEVRNVL